MDILSKCYRFRRGTGSPFDVVPNPGLDLGGSDMIPVQWCTRCNMAVETRSESYNQNQVFAQKHWCKRCGAVTASAVYFHVESLTTPETLLLQKAKQWVNTSESKG